MIAQIQQDMEDNLYEVLKEGKIGEKTIEKYPHQPVEELADIMTEGYKASWVGKFVKHLDKIKGFEAMCNGAFRGAMIKVLKEAKELTNG